MRIGPIKFPNQVALAPMAGVSDPPFRQLAAHLGAGMTPSEMITSDVKRWKTTNLTGINYQQKNLKKLQTELMNVYLLWKHVELMKNQ